MLESLFKSCRFKITRVVVHSRNFIFVFIISYLSIIFKYLCQKMYITVTCLLQFCMWHLVKHVERILPITCKFKAHRFTRFVQPVCKKVSILTQVRYPVLQHNPLNTENGIQILFQLRLHCKLQWFHHVSKLFA